MLGWITSWWGSDLASGPARNAPNNGKNIKQLFEQRPQQVIIVTADVITQTLNGLRKTVINEIPPISQKPAIMQEFDNIFSQGVQAYLRIKRQQRPSSPSISVSLFPGEAEAPPRHLICPVDSDDESSFSSNSDAEEWTTDEEQDNSNEDKLEIVIEDNTVDEDDRIEVEMDQKFEQAISMVEAEMDEIEQKFEQDVQKFEAEVEQLEAEMDAMEEAEMEAEIEEAAYLLEQKFEEEIRKWKTEMENQSSSEESEIDSEAYTSTDSDENSSFYNNDSTEEDLSDYEIPNIVTQVLALRQQ